MMTGGRGGAVITAVGHFFPSKVVPNSYFASYLDTNDEWIVTRTGVRERRFYEEGPTSDMAEAAARSALAQRGMSPAEVDTIIVATTTPDTIFPCTACIVQHKLGAVRAWGFDLLAACSGFVYALTTAAKLVSGGASRNVLVIGADKMSSILDMNDRATCILFGDAAGAFLVEGTDDPSMGILGHANICDGAGGPALIMPAGGSAMPTSAATVAERLHYVHQDGPIVFKAAVKAMAEACQALLQQHGLTVDDVAYVVPHQANIRIIQSSMARIPFPMERVMINLDRYGNTTAATIPTCIAEAQRKGQLKRGDNLVLLSFGAGFTCGALLVRWGS
ncbi:MAG TPA: beta-ketoacyl-ACP synthase III [Polyangiaceae bacterium]|nr:beta-ketoacyl-ACP synthase III [Polyangiaceae bacterium]